MAEWTSHPIQKKNDGYRPAPRTGSPLLHLAENENTEQATLLRQSFQELGDKCRTILGLYYYRKKSLNEIALELNNTENSIKTIKYRCMMQLRQLFLEKSRQHGGL